MDIKLILAIILLVCVGTLNGQGQVIDPFAVESELITVQASDTNTLTNFATDSNILGGERDLIIQGPGQTSAQGCSASTFVAAGIWAVSNGVGCGAEATLQFDGSDNGSAAITGFSPVNLNSLGSGFIISYSSDLNQEVDINIYDSTGGVSTAFFEIIASSGSGGSDQTDVASYSEFSGNADFSSVVAIELVFPVTNAARDARVNLFEFIATAASGRVFGDCNCNDIQDSGDNGVNNASVTLRPVSGCAGSTTLSATTNTLGDWSVESVESCSYEICVASGGTACNGCRTVNFAVDPLTGNNFGLQQGGGSLQIPADTTVTCNESTDPSNTGQATSVAGPCGSGGTVTFTDEISPIDTCANNFVISRRWCLDGAECQVQAITVQDTGGDPVIEIPADVTISCTASSDPSNTGSARATDDCTVNPSVSFEDTSSQGECNRELCGVSTTILRTWTANDGCGGTDSGVQTILREPCVGEVPECPTVYVNDDEDCATPTPDICPEDDDDFSIAQDDDDDDGEDDDGADDDSASMLSISVVLVFAVFFTVFF